MQFQIQPSLQYAVCLDDQWHTENFQEISVKLYFKVSLLQRNYTNKKQIILININIIINYVLTIALGLEFGLRLAACNYA